MIHTKLETPCLILEAAWNRDQACLLLDLSGSPLQCIRMMLIVRVIEWIVYNKTHCIGMNFSTTARDLLHKHAKAWCSCLVSAHTANASESELWLMLHLQEGQI